MSRAVIVCLLLATAAGCGGAERPETRVLLSHANALRANDWPAREAAVERCALDPTPGAVRIFCTAGHDPDDRVRLAWDRAIDRLADRGGVEWLLRDGLTHPDRAVRYAAWRRWLAPPIPADAVAKALPWLEDNFEEIQVLALDRLGATHDPAILNAARFLVRPKYPPRVRLRAAALLDVPKEAGFVNAGLSAAVEAATAALPEGMDDTGDSRPALPPPPDFTFERAIERLGDGLTDPAAVSLLAEIAVDAGTRPGQSPSAAFRFAKRAELAIRLLHRSRQPEAGLALLTLARDGASPPIRREAIAALADIDHPIRDERLVDMLRTEPDPQMRLALASAWHGIRNRSDEAVRTIDALRPGEKDWRVRMSLYPPHRYPADSPSCAAIQSAVEWLIRNQEFDGRWDALRWNPHPPEAVCATPTGTSRREWNESLREPLDRVATALALLALIGAHDAGITDDSPYHAALRCAAVWLIGRFDRDGFAEDPTLPPEWVRLRRRSNGLVRWAIAEWLAYEARRAGDRALHLDNRGDISKWFPGEAFCPRWSEGQVAPDSGGDRSGAAATDLEDSILSMCAVRACRIGTGGIEALPDGGLSTVVDDLPDAPPELRRTLHEIGSWLAKGRDLEAVVCRSVAGRLLALSAGARYGAVPSNGGPTFLFSGLGSTARAVVLSGWFGHPLGTGRGAESAQTWLGMTGSPDVPSIALLSFHRPAWEPYFEILGPQKTVPDPLWPFPRTGELAADGVEVFSSWEDDIVDMDYWFWGALAADGYRDEAWAKGWRASLERVLLAEQRKAGAECGSWDPEGPWERLTGRVGATALGAMALEVPERRWGMQR